MGRLSVGRCGVGFVGVLADLAVWASARGLVFLTDLKQCREWLGFVFLFLICDTGCSLIPISYYL